MAERLFTTARSKELGLLALLLLWLFVGLFGHDPWKPEDAVTFGVAYDLLQNGDWVVPHLAGEPFVHNPPLFTATAALFARASAWLLPLHDGARLASLLYVGGALAFVAKAAESLYGREIRWPAVLVLAGCLGLWDRSHKLVADTATLCAFAAAAWGFGLVRSRPAAAGMLLGAAAGAGFLARGIFAPVGLGAAALLLLAFAEWRDRRYATALGVAAAVAAPLLLVWPAALHARSPELFTEWFWESEVGWLFGGFAPGSGREPWFYLLNLPWIAWPAWPLALWALRLRMRGFEGGLSGPGIQVPAVLTLATLSLLGLSADARASYALPILVPLALLGASSIDKLKRGHSAFLDWFGILTWGFSAAALWILWIQSTTTGMAPGVARLFGDAKRGYLSPVEPGALAAGLALTLLWFLLVRPAHRTPRRAVLNWFAGATLVWGMVMTLWLPYQESRRSYRPVAAALRAALPPDAGCVASRGLGESQRASLHYFAGLTTVREEVSPLHRCDHLLVQASTREGDPSLPGWQRILETARQGDGEERLRLYRREAGG
jgi:4-amino-4-deoxy-L-arabinose transferase-like glycosyltransferase